MRPGPAPQRLRLPRVRYLGQGSFSVGTHGGGGVAHEKSDNTSLPGRLVLALASVPADVQKKCCVLPVFFVGLTFEQLTAPTPENVAFRVPSAAPPV